ncbi:MAG: carbohydrate kinase [Spirochaetes bacterium]|nr:MAG: carbohydrate kinase [Spirochaetota bacterium]
MEKSQIQTILEKIRKAKIAVIGDFCLDAYYFLDPELSELSVETGLKTQGVSDFRIGLGGAANVAHNLKAMGVGRVDAFGITGKDMYGREMIRLMKACGIGTGNLLVQDEQWKTNVYSKFYENHREAPRMDIGNNNIPRESVVSEILQNLVSSIDSYNLLIINQQLGNGLHTGSFRRSLADFLGGKCTIPAIVDSRDFNDFYPQTIRKLNEYEGAAILKKPLRDTNAIMSDDQAGETASALFKRWGKTVFLTRGSRGCILADKSGIKSVPGIHTPVKIDTVGAGDSMLAGIAAALSSGCQASIAMELGNIAATVTVQKLFQTGTAGPEEILKQGDNPDYLYNTEKTSLSAERDYYKNSEIEIIEKKPYSRDFKYALFDHDGTISTLREGWEKIMEPMMVESILGDKRTGIDERSFERVSKQVSEYIEKTTGIQTINQMMGLIKIIRDNGYVPEDEILTAVEYKSIFNTRLLNMVRKRVKRIESGNLSPEDYTVKGSISFLKYLRGKEITLFLASGTDEEDVKKEASFMGYASFFNGGIFGSLGNPDEDPKRMVVKKIINDIGRDAAAGIVTFGDGPVELRETKKRGGYCIGLVSDEVKRHGINQAKRKRLVSAGADILIPDFSYTEELEELLFPGVREITHV